VFGEGRTRAELAHRVPGPLRAGSIGLVS
jgi:hypothetical protein